MIVFIVLFEGDYYPSTIEGVFTTRKLAEDFVEILSLEDDIFAGHNIYEEEVCDSK